VALPRYLWFGFAPSPGCPASTLPRAGAMPAWRSPPHCGRAQPCSWPSLLKSMRTHGVWAPCVRLACISMFCPRLCRHGFKGGESLCSFADPPTTCAVWGAVAEHGSPAWAWWLFMGAAAGVLAAHPRPIDPSPRSRAGLLLERRAACAGRRYTPGVVGSAPWHPRAPTLEAAPGRRKSSLGWRHSAAYVQSGHDTLIAADGEALYAPPRSQRTHFLAPRPALRPGGLSRPGGGLAGWPALPSGE
jgi:hypothetical protein